MRKSNDFCLWHRPCSELLSREQLTKIYDAALHVLERVGGDFHDQEAVELLSGAGAHVKDGKRVRIPSHLVEQALGTVPRRVVIADRGGRARMFLERENVYFGTGSDTNFTLDPYTGKRRKALKEDVAKAALLVDYLSDIDFCMSFGLASDVNPMTSDCHHFEAMVSNTEKPLIMCCWDVEGLKRIFDMMVAVRGSEEDLEARPFVLIYVQAISPLVFPRESLQKLLFCAEKRIPLIWIPGCPTMGATGPIHPAGTMVVGVAEFLAGVLLTQLKRKGSPVIGSGRGCCVLDMQTGLMPYGAPEYGMGDGMARFLNIPSWGTGGVSDSKILDEQAVAEAYQSLYHSALFGSNLIHDVGYLDNGNTSSPELLTMCNDLISKTRRFLRSFVVSQETLSLDVIEQVGPGGTFLDHPQTAEHFRDEIWMPELLDRQDHDGWVASGSRTFKERANEKARWILENHEPARLPSEVARDLRRIVEEYDRTRGKG
ncbi:MAG: trimethylamine methyltransferase family protein [Deltaproteobacteria bacterium]|nr:trimethylamine methyltransferase family protein [Deltaproteobacteria bacterium]MBW2120637.1 trimethylamine methyltransferase family protein [Deltaproteobacteria bacterium]